MIGFIYIYIYVNQYDENLLNIFLICCLKPSVSYQLLPLKSAPYRHLFSLRGLQKCWADFGQKWEHSFSKITNIVLVALDCMKACTKFNWKILEMFFTASTMKDFRSLVDAVGDQDMKSSFICMSPLRQILAFHLSRSPYMFN